MLTGTFRVYFNRHGAAPLVWSVATDDFELNVSEVRILAPMASVYLPKATPDDEDGKPSAGLAVAGVLTLRGSVATISEHAC